MVALSAESFPESQGWIHGRGLNEAWAFGTNKEQIHAEARMAVLEHAIIGRRVRVTAGADRLDALERDVASLNTEVARLRAELAQLQAKERREEQEYAVRELASKQIIEAILGRGLDEDEDDDSGPAVEFTKAEAEAIARLIEGDD